MSLLSIVATLFVVGIVYALFTRFFAKYIDGDILDIIKGVIIIAIVLWLLQVFGIFASLSTIHVGH